MNNFKIQDDGRPPFVFEVVFGHNSAASFLISVKFCVGKQFFTEFGNGTDTGIP